MELIIEQISRDHKVIARHKLDADTINIGRGFHNDIILSDPHVCAHHLQIEYLDDHWHVRDMGSVNGSFNGHSKPLNGDHQVQSGDLISLGKSQLRLLFPDHPVAASVKLSAFENALHLLKSPWLLTLFIALFTGLNGANFYLHATEQTTSSQLIVNTLSITLLFGLWPLLCALVARLTKHEPRIMAQLIISFLFFNLFITSDLLEMLISFNLSSQWLFHWLPMILPISLVFGLLWSNFYLAFQFGPQRRFILAAGLTGLLFGGNYLIKVSQQPDFIATPIYNPTLLGPSFVIAPANSVDHFIEDSEVIFDKARKLAERDKKKQQ